jgi:hypothetical protein
LYIKVETRRIRNIERKLREVDKIGIGKEERNSKERRRKSDRVRVNRRSGRVVIKIEE